MDIKQLYKSFVASMPKKWWAFFTIFLILSALGFSIHRFFTEGNYTNLYRSIFDPVGLFIGIFTFLISILITLKIQYNTDKDAELKQKILAGDNSFIKIKTNEIKTSIEVLLKQYQNIEVLNKRKRK